MYLTFNPLDVMTFFHRETDHSPMDFGFPIFRQSQIGMTLTISPKNRDFKKKAENSTTI